MGYNKSLGMGRLGMELGNWRRHLFQPCDVGSRDVALAFAAAVVPSAPSHVVKPPGVRRQLGPSAAQLAPTLEYRPSEFQSPGSRWYQA